MDEGAGFDEFSSFKLDPGSGFILGLPRSIGSRFSHVEGCSLPLNIPEQVSTPCIVV